MAEHQQRLIFPRKFQRDLLGALLIVLIVLDEQGDLFAREFARFCEFVEI